MKYEVTMALPARLMIQKLRGMVGRPARFVARACTSQRPANIRAPMKTTSFHGGTTMPKELPITALIIGLVLAHQPAGFEPPSQPHHADDVDDSHPQAVQHSIFRRAARARPVAHRNGHAPRALAKEQCRQEAVHVVEARQLDEYAALEQLDAAAGVRRAVT